MRGKNFLLGLLTVGHAAEHWLQAIFGPILPLLKDAVPMTYQQVGWLIAMRQLVGAALNVGAGVVVDRVGRRRLFLAIGIATSVLAYLLMTLVPMKQVNSYLLLLILVGITGVSSGLWHAPAMSLLAEIFGKRKGFALGVHHVGPSFGEFLGAAISGAFLGYLMNTLSLSADAAWRLDLAILLSFPAVAALSIFLLVPNVAGHEGTPINLGNIARAMLVNPKMLALMSVESLRSMSHMMFQGFLPLYLADTLDMDPPQVGLYVGVSTVLGVVASPVIGAASDRFGRKTVLAIGLGSAGVFALAITAFGPGLALLAVLALIGCFFYPLRPVVFATAAEITPPDMGGTTVGFVFGVNQAVAAFALPLAGFVADRFHITYVFYVVAAFTFASTILAVVTLPGRAPRPTPAAVGRAR